ncbi:arfaptin-1-like isoform X1 [Takifugu flavidus]|uniref:arfaptin-1-like isoform X1 n=2 Tax=Takifugu flavidus TaxID=433684 RepID=UPI002544557E|nr:arfaptin-1-like isoform X1 [Takifugu flavidus]
MEQSGGVPVEDRPLGSNGTCHHNGGDVTSCPPEVTSEVTMETEERKDEDTTVTPQETGSGTVVQVNNMMSASETLQRVRRWSVSKYKATRQALSEKLGRGSRTVDLDLESQLDLLRDDRQRYENVTALAQTLANQLAQFTATQKTLGDAFSDLGLKTPPLHVEFSLNADAQKFLSKSGKTLSDAIGAFTSDMNTLVNKTMEDTMINARQYEAARIQYDAYRVDLEELNLKPRDTNTLPKLERAQREFQDQRERYQKIRHDLSVKVKLLEENKVKVLHHQLWLLHGAMAAHTLSCHSFLDQSLQHAMTELKNMAAGSASFLEER